MRIKPLFDLPTIASEPRTNTIIARGEQAEVQILEALLQRLDEPTVEE
ncbi:MAG TPA: hypothetical protein DDW52_23015 [Planctomycetaceae bacterium]|nr:hypothetical protein [Planctomycetaceae bacterium]